MGAFVPSTSTKFLSVEEDSHTYLFHCPGCDMLHEIWDKQAKRDRGWDFNGDLNNATFSPSYLTRYPMRGVDVICHSFIENGNIRFLDDCTHKLAGHTVPLPDIPE